VSRPTRGPLSRFPVRGCHPLRRAFPDASGTKDNGHWPGPRSLATTDGISRQVLSQPPSRAARATRVLMSVPPATEMFQFTGFASCTYEFSTGYPCGWVAPFGDPGITDRSHLPRAFRSVPRPSSPLSAKASTRCPCFALDHRIAVTGDAAPPPRTGPNPVPASATAESGGLYEDTSLGQASGQALLDPRGLSASVTSQLSLHPSINPTAVARGGVAQSSPNVGHALARQTGQHLAVQPRCTVGRQSSALGGGGERVRTDDLLLAKQALSQLSYTPAPGIRRQRSGIRMSDPR
jgi:hypothetical protein